MSRVIKVDSMSVRVRLHITVVYADGTESVTELACPIHEISRWIDYVWTGAAILRDQAPSSLLLGVVPAK